MLEIAKDSAQFLLTSDAAAELHVTAQTVRAYEASGRLRAVRTPGGWRLFMREDVERLKAERLRRPVRGVRG